MIVRGDEWALIDKEEGIEVDPGGTVGLSPSGRGVVFEIPGEGGVRICVDMSLDYIEVKTYEPEHIWHKYCYHKKLSEEYS